MLVTEAPLPENSKTDKIQPIHYNATELIILYFKAKANFYQCSTHHENNTYQAEWVNMVEIADAMLFLTIFI